MPFLQLESIDYNSTRLVLAHELKIQPANQKHSQKNCAKVQNRKKIRTDWLADFQEM
jgi:hypothetical protein